VTDSRLASFNVTKLVKRCEKDLSVIGETKGWHGIRQEIVGK